MVQGLGRLPSAAHLSRVPGRTVTQPLKVVGSDHSTGPGKVSEAHALAHAAFVWGAASPNTSSGEADPEPSGLGQLLPARCFGVLALGYQLRTPQRWSVP